VVILRRQFVQKNPHFFHGPVEAVGLALLLPKTKGLAYFLVRKVQLLHLGRPLLVLLPEVQEEVPLISLPVILELWLLGRYLARSKGVLVADISHWFAEVLNSLSRGELFRDCGRYERGGFHVERGRVDIEGRLRLWVVGGGEVWDEGFGVYVEGVGHQSAQGV